MRSKKLLIIWGFIIFSGLAQGAEVYRIDQILAKHIRAMGGEALLSRLESIEYTSQVKAGMLSGKSTTWVLTPDRIRYELELGVIDEVSCYNGLEKWVVDANGLMSVGDESARMEMAAEAMLAGLRYVFPDTSMRVRFIERLGELDRSYLVLEVQSTRTLPVKLWIDERTFLLSKAEIAPQGFTVAYEYDDYRSADGLMFPFRIRKSVPQLNEERELTVLEVKVNQPVDERLFISHVPPSEAYAFKSGNKALIPFELDVDRIYFSGEINGQGPFDFIFDSEAEFSAIDSRVAMRLGLGEVSVGKQTTIAGYEELPLVRLDSMNLEGLALYGQIIPSLDHDRVERLYPGHTPAVVFGYDLLSLFVSELRFSDNTLVFTERKGYAAPAGYSFIECDYRDRFPIINAFIEDKPARLVVSTSSPSTIDLSDYFVKRHNLMKAKMTFESELHPYVTSARMYMARMKLVSFGPFEFENTPVAFAQSATSGILASERYDGIIGTGIMRRFDFGFDYQGGRIAIRPNDSYSEEFVTAKSGLKLSYKDDGRIIVEGVIPGSPGESAQIEPGSELLEIAGKDVRSLGVAGVRQMITAPDMTEYEIKTAKGGHTRVTKLVLKTYY